MSRAQMEIFGLVIIVILLALGLLFAIVVLTKPSGQQVQQLKESVQAANLLHTAMGTTVDECSKRTVRELVQNCALASVVDGRVIGASVCSDGLDSCVKADIVLSILLDKTLGNWDKNYEFFITGTQAAELIRVNNGTCPGIREGTIRPEKVRPGLDVNLTLYIC